MTIKNKLRNDVNRRHTYLTVYPTMKVWSEDVKYRGAVPWQGYSENCQLCSVSSNLKGKMRRRWR